MSPPIELLVNAVPMVNVNTGIGRYLRCLYAEMERAYRDRLEIGYFDGVKVLSMMPCGPSNLNRWTKGIDLFWRMPVYPAFIARLAFHFVREASLPEVAGDGAVFMQDPHDVNDLARILGDLAADPAMRQRLVDKGFAQAGRFSWRETAKKTFEAFKAVLK